MRRIFGLFLLAAALAGCQSGGQNLQGQVDSLRAANQELQQQVQSLRDSLSTTQQTATLSPPVYFPSGSEWLFNDARQKLDKHAQTLKQKYPNADLRIQGYTDSVPIGPSLTDTYPSNWYLAAHRAAAVAHYLDKEHGIRSDGLKIEAYARSAGPGETPERQPKQRRVEIVVTPGS